MKNYRSITIISTPSIFPCESNTQVYAKKFIMSIVPRNCKIEHKNSRLPEIVKLQLIQLQHPADRRLKATIGLIRSKPLTLVAKYWRRANTAIKLKITCTCTMGTSGWSRSSLFRIYYTRHAAKSNRIHHYQHS